MEHALATDAYHLTPIFGLFIGMFALFFRFFPFFLFLISSFILSFPFRLLPVDDQSCHFNVFE